MSQRFITSDLHFGHELVANLRGFDTTAEHDDALAEQWHKVVRQDDTVFVLGDVVGRSKDWTYALDRIDKLPGVKHLVSGNHDSCSSIHRNGWQHQREALRVFESVRDFARIKFRRHTVLMSHYPYDDDHTEGVRYAEYRLRDEGLPLLHGHTHRQKQRLHLSDKGTPQMHVGHDAWGGPVPLDLLLEELLRESGEA
jgi:calcineurin-like phosphoesterase family protein